MAPVGDVKRPEVHERCAGRWASNEDVLGCPVDLVTEKAPRPELRPFVERDAIHV